MQRECVCVWGGVKGISINEILKRGCSLSQEERATVCFYSRACNRAALSAYIAFLNLRVRNCQTIVTTFDIYVPKRMGNLLACSIPCLKTKKCCCILPGKRGMDVWCILSSNEFLFIMLRLINQSLLKCMREKRASSSC